MSMTKQDPSSRHFQRKISEFCEVRIAPIAPKRVLEKIRPYLMSLIIYRKPPPILNGRIDWMTIGQACGIEDPFDGRVEEGAAMPSQIALAWLLPVSRSPARETSIISTRTSARSGWN
ncbi:hypothetical protein [Rhizobium leguminosarum]|uniref:hypothetical protein n=1 Tax=Rhizobium leguminosarum TaxID=384 RepID=UPI0021BBE7C6|nr:hypothetical protein [Rhizobium leguminosarum]